MRRTWSSRSGESWNTISRGAPPAESVRTVTGIPAGIRRASRPLAALITSGIACELTPRRESSSPIVSPE